MRCNPDPLLLRCNACHHRNIARCCEIVLHTYDALTLPLLMLCRRSLYATRPLSHLYQHLSSVRAVWFTRATRTFAQAAHCAPQVMGLSSDEVQGLGTEAGSKQLWKAFYELAQTPRMSRHEAAVLQHVRSIADQHGLRQTSDAAGNLAVFRPGTGSGAAAQPVIVQAHVDMVCEKNDGTQVSATVMTIKHTQQK